MPAGTVLAGCSLFQSRIVFRCVAMADCTRASLFASERLSDFVHSAAFFSCSASDFNFASSETGLIGASLPAVCAITNELHKTDMPNAKKYFFILLVLFNFY